MKYDEKEKKKKTKKEKKRREEIKTLSFLCKQIWLSLKSMNLSMVMHWIGGFFLS